MSCGRQCAMTWPPGAERICVGWRMSATSVPRPGASGFGDGFGSTTGGWAERLVARQRGLVALTDDELTAIAITIGMIGIRASSPAMIQTRGLDLVLPWVSGESFTLPGVPAQNVSEEDGGLYVVPLPPFEGDPRWPRDRDQPFSLLAVSLWLPQC